MEAAGGDGDRRLGPDGDVPAPGAENEPDCLWLDVAKTSRQGPRRQPLGDDSPVAGLVSQASADLRRTTALCSTADLPQVLDVLPGISLIRPPFVPVNTTTFVEVFFDCATVCPAALELVGVAGSVEVLRQQVPGALAQPMRFKITPVGVGVVDFFVCGSDMQGNAAAGIPGHLCALPELAARDGNRIYDKVVKTASREGRFFGEYAVGEDGGSGQNSNLGGAKSNISGRQEHDGQSSKSFCLSSGLRGLSGSGLQVSQQSGEAQSEDSKAQQPDRPSSSSNYLTNCWSDVFLTNLEVQKWAWKENLVQFVLELEVVLLSLKPQRAQVPGLFQTSVLGIDKGPALVLVVENMLHQLRLFHAWELMAFVLSRVLEGGIYVCWEKETLSHEALTTANLKERYHQQEKDIGLDLSEESSEEDFPMGTATSSLTFQTDDIFLTAPLIESVCSGVDEGYNKLGQAPVDGEAGGWLGGGEKGPKSMELQVEAGLEKWEVHGVPAVVPFSAEKGGMCIDSGKEVGTMPASSACDQAAEKKPLLASFWQKIHRRFKVQRNGNRQMGKRQDEVPGIWPDLPIGPLSNSVAITVDGNSPTTFREHTGIHIAGTDMPPPAPENEPSSRSPLSSASPSSSRDLNKKLKKSLAGATDTPSGDGTKHSHRLKSMFGSLRKAFSKSSQHLVQEEDTEPRSGSGFS